MSDAAEPPCSDDAQELVRRFFAEQGGLTFDELEQMRAWARARMAEGAARARAYDGPEVGAAIVDLRKALGWPFGERTADLHTLAQAVQESPVTVHLCGPATATCSCSCASGGPCEHQWDGATQTSEDGLIGTVTCSRCGMAAIDHDMWVGP